ncbi:PHP domain-containing protein [Actinoplanes sp. CA-030573]|uniref:PHP domain-containing protein n=1 Tax=Actinoplanes sp. CA-030573 TaxID=3239898 RepID=UPI003D8CDFD0
MSLPADSHVHSEWSWDTPVGDMERTCEQAIRLGLPAVAFTEHVDHVSWAAPTEGPYVSAHLTAVAGDDGIVRPPGFDADGYLECVERCREKFPGLRILSGLELGEPHWFAAPTAALLHSHSFDRVLGSLHCLRDGDGVAEPWAIYPHRDAGEVLRDYLAGVVELVTTCDSFAVLAHIDYALRSWPGADVRDFEEEFRAALRATAGTQRALEINTRIPLAAVLLRWWREEGGDAVSFGSDAHLPDLVGHGFREAAAMAEAYGFRPGRHPYELWGRA